MDANQNRKEYKFVLPPGVGEQIRAEVSEQMVADRGFTEGYPVLSEYFDSEERCNYWQKQLGVKNRRKIRTRLYGEESGAIPPSAFIEVKHKYAGTTVKRRINVELDEIEEFTTDNTLQRDDLDPAADQKVQQEIENIVTGQDFQPVVQIRYHRYAFDSGPEGQIRITFDVDPRCRFQRVPLTPGDPDFELPLLDEGVSLMEVKTIGSVPYWFRTLLGKYRLVPRGFSKYATALELYEFKLRDKKTLPVLQESA